MSDPQVYIAGQKVEALAPVGDLVISHEWPTAGIGGPASVQFSLLLPPSKRPGWLTRGALAEIRLSGLALLAGSVADVDWSDGTVTIDAAAREGSSTSALTAGGLTSSTPDTFIDAAISRGALTWSRPASISTTALANGDTGNLNNVRDLIAAYANESGTRIYVDPWRRILKGADPTAPDLFTIPGASELSWTVDQQATRIIGRWANTAGTLATTVVGSGAIERNVDMTPLGGIDVTRATNILNNILTKATSGGWNGGITLSASQFLGTVSLADVANRVGRGLMIRLNGQRDPRPGRVPVSFVDFIVDRSEWHVADGTITLSPRGLVSTSFADLAAEAGVQEAA